jgi:hypothetical protein
MRVRGMQVQGVGTFSRATYNTAICWSPICSVGGTVSIAATPLSQTSPREAISVEYHWYSLPSATPVLRNSFLSLWAPFREVCTYSGLARISHHRSCSGSDLVQIMETKRFFPEGGVGLVPKRGCLLTLAYYAFPRWYEFGERRWNDIDRGKPKKSEKNLSQCQFVHHKLFSRRKNESQQPMRTKATKMLTPFC